jgi:flagellin-like hook-associated protein FlgL
MAVVINSNPSATMASNNLSKANEALRKSLARLSSGHRIVNPEDDAGGLAVAYKLAAQLKRNNAIRHNVQNGISFLQVQDAALTSAGSVVSRMAELRAMAQDVTKNTGDIENYSKEFLELQMHLGQLYREKFNGVSLFAVSNSDQKLHAGQPILNKGTYSDENGEDITKFSRQVFTHDSGLAEDGNVSIGVINFEDVFKLGALDSKYVENFTGKLTNLANAGGLNSSNYSTEAAVVSSGPLVPIEGSAVSSTFSADDSSAGTFTIHPNVGGDRGNNYTLKVERLENRLASGGSDASFADADSDSTLSSVTDSLQSVDVNGVSHRYQLLNEEGTDNYILQYEVIDDGSGGFTEPNVNDFNTMVEAGAKFVLDDSLTNNPASWGISNFSDSLNAETPLSFSGGEGEYTTTEENAEVFTEDGFLSSILSVSMEQFTQVINRIADARAENGAEQSRLMKVEDLLSSKIANLEAAHGRIMDVDVALEASNLARNNVLVQSSAAMVAQANQLTSIALTILTG